MIVVTGASGNVGRELLRQLAGENVRAVSRQPTKYRADLNEPESLRPALDGADALFLLVAGDYPHGILDVAKTSGIRRIVLLSSQGAGTRPGAYPHPVSFENALRRSDMDWTVLRPGGFHSNTFAWAESIRAHATVAAPSADVALPAIDPADIAAVAATVLREPGYSEKTYVLTGPAPISPRQQAGAIGAALGKNLRFLEQTREQARDRFSQFMPAPVVEATLDILGNPLPQETAVSSDVAAILGRAPGTFADWAVRNAAAFTS